jgi:hypothetical protein
MIFVFKLLAPAIIGGLGATAAVYTLVSVQTAPPDPSGNPANEQIIVYGD